MTKGSLHREGRRLKGTDPTQPSSRVMLVMPVTAHRVKVDIDLAHYEAESFLALQPRPKSTSSCSFDFHGGSHELSLQGRRLEVPACRCDGLAGHAA